MESVCYKPGWSSCLTEGGKWPHTVLSYISCVPVPLWKLSKWPTRGLRIMVVFVWWSVHGCMWILHLMYDHKLCDDTLKFLLCTMLNLTAINLKTYTHSCTCTTKSRVRFKSLIGRSAVSNLQDLFSVEMLTNIRYCFTWFEVQCPHMWHSTTRTHALLLNSYTIHL